jgi:hypothetical protein
MSLMHENNILIFSYFTETFDLVQNHYYSLCGCWNKIHSEPQVIQEAWEYNRFLPYKFFVLPLTVFIKTVTAAVFCRNIFPCYTYGQYLILKGLRVEFGEIQTPKPI